MRTIRAFDEYPLCILLETDFLQKRRQLHPSPFGATDHAMCKLQRIQLRATPFHPAIGRTFDEMNPRRGRKPQNILHGQNQRPIDQPMDHKSMLVRIDVGSSRMVSLEEQSVRSDNPMQVLQRRETDGRLGSSREPRHVPPDHASLGIGGPAIGPIDNTYAKRLGPRIIRGRRSFFRMNASAIKQQPGGERAGHLQQRPSSDANPAGILFSGHRLDFPPEFWLHESSTRRSLEFLYCWFIVYRYSLN